MKFIKYLSLSLIVFLSFTANVQAQENDPVLPYRVAPQNLLKFNRFLINPTFTTVREDKSYVNLLHRNQSVQFQDNDQTYFLSYSGRIGDKSGLGLSLYSQRIGPISNIGVLANYAYGIKLSDKSNFTFGGNLAYYSTGLNRNGVDVVDQDDFLLNGTEDSNILSFQPGFNISYGKFDFGAFAENLIEYNLKTSESLSDFADKGYSAHLQYTHPFDKSSGLLENARLMPLARVRMNSQRVRSTEENDLTYGGSLILDLPKLGWLQGGYDSFYGASVGAGFNINKRLSLGYSVEKGFVNDFDNLGVTHEISFAYSFTPNLTEDRVMLEDNNDELASNEEIDPTALTDNEEIAELKRKLAENDAIIAELMFRQDSLEANRQQDLERRFEMVMRMVRNETSGERPDLEKRAENLFRSGNDKTTVAATTSYTNPTEQSSSDNGIASTAKTDEKENITTGTNTTSQERDAVVAATVPTRRTTPGTDRQTATTATTSAQDNTQSSSYAKVAETDKIKSRKFRDLDGVENGYYIVANVYKGGKYMEKFMNSLDDKGIVSDYIDNPKNGLKYVYLERYDNWEDASAAYLSNLGGNYDGPMWVMNVDSRYTNEAYASNVDKIQKKASQYGTNTFKKNTVIKDKIAASKPAERNFRLEGVGSGYYIIANVFANPENAKRFVKTLNSYGLSASYFINPENNWRYVYLKRHASWNNALISYYSKINDSYEDKMWIMRVHQQDVLA
ncbi:type IX secretion system membrane protein PorP/SprF [Aggregatimonas sangjinii]|uniref:Type IX secretion system membrane protein PorP/SprF n=1 Tax=Aggregatimonas sangjinii TaxID=2583587 RepID=A0A5B7SYK9_9FLAO|nr:type IX secretion system membrane protein PorP/SprF [Aggregatimonas sangjinii]QCX01890.1 type IX secretion system membrane protein PorP/SprF [Aggregatimonas sangjinii]